MEEGIGQSSVGGIFSPVAPSSRPPLASIQATSSASFSGLTRSTRSECPPFLSNPSGERVCFDDGRDDGLLFWSSFKSADHHHSPNIFRIDPRVAPLKVLTYRYMRSAGGSLPPPPEPLFTTSGMPNYPIARQPDYFRRVFRYADAKITGKPLYPDQQQQGHQAIVVPAYDDKENGTEGEKAEAAVPKIVSPGEAEIKRLKKKAEKSSNLSKADEERERRRELIEHLRQEVDQLQAEGREAEAARKKATLESLLLNKKQSSWW